VRVEAARILRTINAELFKISRRRMTYILLTVLVLLVLVSYTLLWLRIRNGPSPRRSGYADWIAAKSAMAFLHVTPSGLALERFFATIICVIFAGTMVGNEFDWRTIGLVVSRGTKRWHLLLAKTLICVGFVFTAIALGFCAAILASAWFSHLYHLPYGSASFPRIWTAVASLCRTVFVILPFVLLAVLGATVWRSAGQAVGATLGVFFLEGIFTGLLNNAEGWVSHVPQALLNVNGDSIIRANGFVSGGPFTFGSGAEPYWRAALILCLWAAGFVAVAFWRFQRRDISD
jgi:ABC-type transport system involved in multi-copper enzyme maturation permease subunit